jgi:hypothetical protein
LYFYKIVHVANRWQAVSYTDLKSNVCISLLCVYFFVRLVVGRHMTFISFTLIGRGRQLASFGRYFQVGLGRKRVDWKGKQL